MERFTYTENARSMRLAAQRDPVEAAYYALASLSQPDREKAVARFNSTYRDLSTVPALIWSSDHAKARGGNQ